MSDFGQIFVSIDGENIPASGNVTFNNLNLGETSFDANLDGSLHGTFSPMPATAEIENVSACAIPLEELIALMNRCSGDDADDRFSVLFGLTGSCAENVKTITFVDAKIGGTMNLDGVSGQASGFMIASSNVLVNGVNVRGRGR